MPTIEELLSAIRERRITGPRRPAWKVLHELADATAPEIRAAFLRAVAQTTSAARIETIETALRMGNLQAAEQAIPWDDVAVKELNATLPNRLRDLVIAAGIAAERMQPPGVNFSFNVQNPLAVKAAAEQAAELVTEISVTTREAIRQSITRALEEQRTPAQAAREIRDMIGLHSRQESGLATLRAKLEDSGRPEAWIERRMARETRQALSDRATTIAFHETMTAANAGQQALWEQARDAGLIQGQTRREFVVTPDDRLCTICRPLDGNTYGLTEPIVTEFGSVLSPPIHVNCLPGNALVTPGDRIAAQSERRYQGELCILRTARGKRLACTPNHPVLTRRGWVPARAAYEAGHVIGGGADERMLFRDVDHEDMPSPIEEIARAYRKSGEVSSREVPVPAEYFHSDGKGSEVAVVYSDRLLRDRLDPEVIQENPEPLFVDRLPTALLAGESMSNPLIERRRSAASCVVCGADLFASSFFAHLLPLEQFRFASPARANPSIDKPQPDDIAADSKLIGEALLRRAGTVAEDKVIGVESQSFHGMVYNLDCGGWYIANGIITSNCRCVLVLALT